MVFNFQLLTWTSYGKSVDSTGKCAVILVKLPNFKVIRIKRAKISSKSVKFGDFEELYLR